jgi:hypothetical protein
MAVPEDYAALQRLVKLRGTGISKVLACSPDDRQIEILQPLGLLVCVGKETWDLSKECSGKFDIIVACNVFHYSQDPMAWFCNALKACRELWIQDLFCRNRGFNGLGSDGDQTRYGWHAAIAGTPTFNLNQVEQQLLYCEYYDAGSFRSRQTCVNFAAAFKGNL